MTESIIVATVVIASLIYSAIKLTKAVKGEDDGGCAFCDQACSCKGSSHIEEKQNSTCSSCDCETTEP